MRIFLDVGAHRGQTLAAVLGRGFDRIDCFEPVSEHWPVLERIADSTTRIHRFGLWNVTADAPVWDPGPKGSGLWVKDGTDPVNGLACENCHFVRATEWFRKHVPPVDRVWMKLNVEGAECDILDDLLDSGEFGKVAYCAVEFDSAKIPEIRHRHKFVMERLAQYGWPRVMVSLRSLPGRTHEERLRRWLDLLPP